MRFSRALIVGIADAEHLLHLLDRAVALHEGGDEDLVLERQARELRQFERAFDGDVAVREAHPLDDQGRALRQLGQFLPILGLGHGKSRCGCPSRYGSRKLIFQGRKIDFLNISIKLL